ncbi:peptidoglycan DD-metalloendopeptidase family protein [Devosia sp. XJ19-1]|uniref:Peptidoglycan DD-metalloendopeptidase family protein n=1 Tax=Devosia ureilytica TaxID=2952754 RepID=A0A9Q4AKY6_9HYPH|nr:peptidoglycan DD-metalloendopeptidase family protein [Devosia ureilytica]MCP8882135.1 peptidoglycan DD-metalloendopeptidase family protein [Devosia ureilytica]MCP8885979.1 peptidoglycan DD-metalloendopeptidase family protein [Devosia ureilytica]
MSIRVFPRTHKSAVAVAGVMIAAVGLSGCSSLGGRAFSDSTVTGSTAQSSPTSLNQPMPPTLGAPQGVQLASMEFLPPANVGTSWTGGNTLPPAPVGNGFMQPSGVTSPIGTVQTQALPALSSSSSMGATQAMPAQQNLAPLPAVPAAVAMGNPSTAALPVNSSVPVQATASANAYTHTIAGGESLYTIARKYDVTTQAIVHANGLSSPDKIIVGQKIIIPGRSDLVNTASVQVASASPQAAAPSLPAARPTNLASTNVLQSATAPAPVATPVVAPAQATPAAAPTQMAAVPAAQPEVTASDKFRWPVSGRVITDFAASRGTGINIDVPEGSTVKAADGGTVIYVGSGVEGYGNLVLIRHPNGYVSAYAHLASMSVAKGAVVNGGDAIGAVGQTGSVSRPQLHFELRKGATPVDPVPLLAS